MRPLRIVIVTTSWPANEGDPSGHFVRAHARELEARGHDVEVVAPRPGGAFGWPGVAARLKERPGRSADAVTWVLAARRRLARLEADRVIAHWAIPCAFPIGTACRAPLSIVSHGGDVRLLASLPSPLRRSLARALVRRATGWTFASAELLEHCLGTLDIETRRRVERLADVRAPPIELPDVTSQVARRRRELAGRKVAACVGRLLESKRVDRVIDHVARSGEDIVLVVVGDGPQRAALEERAHRHGIDARFTGTVSRDEALGWIGAADVLLHASEAEGLSTVIREAEALGTRVVRLTR